MGKGYSHLNFFICPMAVTCIWKKASYYIVEQSDFDLIDRIIGGDQSAIRVLIDRHKKYAYTIAIRVVGNGEDAEEIAQDAFVNTLNSLKEFNKKSKFTTWFYTIVFHAAVSLKRKKRIQTEDIDAHHSSKLGDFESMDFQKAEQRKYISLAMQTLKDDDRHVLTLFYLKELSLQEVGDILNISTNTVKIKVHRARKRFAIALSAILKDEVKALL